METSNYKILIVEDSKLNQEVLRRILADEHTIILAQTGDEALELARNEHPDLILLDIILPGMDGFDVLTELKKSDKTRTIPVIIISAMTKPDDEVKGLTLGAVDYITKPFHEIVVKTRVDTHLRILKQMRVIEKFGFIDTLTNIPNRRQFDRDVIREWNRGKRDQTPFSILMIDVDHFKMYNDTHGHQQGDIALVTVASAIKTSLKRSTDIAARWGGEEFAVLLPETGLDGAMSVAEEIRKNVEASMIPGDDSVSVHNVTISIGVAPVVPTDDTNIAEIIRRADEALYKAKDSGRNRVCKYEEETE